MDINVARTDTPEGDLVFTITVSNPHHACFTGEDKKIMELLDFCKNQISTVILQPNKTKEEVVGLIHLAKKKTFMKVLENLKFEIENEFRPKFKPICQEIYNWIKDHQTDELKEWMYEFDPQKTTYYFCNDQKMANFDSPQESEHEYDDDDDDTDFEDEE